MNEKEGKHISIILPGQQGIVYENRSKFPDSVFHKVYERASMLTRDSVNAQSEKSRNIEPYGQMGRNTEPYGQVDNIITFVGRRGTGKSSAMLSFMEGLKHNADDKGDEKYIIRIKPHVNTNFISLDWIDASLLEKSEDIFESILAKMLWEFLNIDDKNQRHRSGIDYDVRDLHQRFDNIYKKVLNLKKRNEKKEFDGETAISVLRDLARSNELREDFEELIKRYIYVISMLQPDRRSSADTDTFLVVAIDDVDMNVDFGFEILENVQRYLKVNGLIVLLSINYEQMLFCCEKHFSRIYADCPNLSEDKRRYVTKIAEEYMEKALPSYMRTYLPSLKKRDYDRDKLTRINAQEVGIETGEKSEGIEIKKVMFYLAYKKIKVRYDCEGKKRHFMEPGTLRNLNNQYFFFKKMDDPEGDNSLEKLEWNHRRSMDDLLFHFTYENLQEKERKFFIELSEEDIRRRGEIIVSRLMREINRTPLEQLQYIHQKPGKEGTHLYLEEYKAYGYSYGGLMRSFYFYSREEIFDKKLVHGLLYMYTMVMTKIFYKYKDKELKESEESEESERRNYEMLKELLGGSAAGIWGLYLLPKIMNIQGKLRLSGAMKHCNMENIRIKLGNLDNIDNMEEILEKDDNEKSKWIADKVKEMTPQILIMLFLSEVQMNPGEAFQETEISLFQVKKDISIAIKISSDEDQRIDNSKSMLCFRKITADFNVLNFINNIFCFEEQMDIFIRSVWYAFLNDKLVLNHKEGKEKVNKVKKILMNQESSFYWKMHQWTREYGGAVIPFYSTDVYYNMLKRLARKRKLKPVPSIKKEELFDYFLNLMNDIKQALQRSDDYYADPLYVTCYDECPVIKEFTKQGNDCIKELFNEFIASIIDKSDANEELDDYSPIFD